jgi:hypothetical protein
MTGLGVAGATALLAAVTAPVFAEGVAWLQVAAVAAFGVGVVVGSDRAVGVAVAPGLGGALLATIGQDSVAAGRSILVGCGWFLATELALESIERRDPLVWSRAVGRHRIREVATVVAAAAGFGGAGVLATAFAPDRTFVIRAALIVSVLTAVTIALRAGTRSPSPSSSDP